MTEQIEMLSGLDRLRATTVVLQRARLADPLAGMWEAADVQWWHGRPRITDEVALPVWFDDAGPVAAAGLTASGESWQVDVFTLPGSTLVADVWAATMDVARRLHEGPFELLVHEDDTELTQLALHDDFAFDEELSGTTWMDAALRPSVERSEGFRLVDRSQRPGTPHPMIKRNGASIEARLNECSLYEPALDLAVEDSEGTVAGYALFWFDERTGVGLLEPMRVEDDYQRRGLARVLLTNGVARLSDRGAKRIKVGFSSEGARALYCGAGFVQTSVDRLLVRPPRAT